MSCQSAGFGTPRKVGRRCRRLRGLHAPFLQESERMSEIRSVWVFNGANASFPSGVFIDREGAETWIEAKGLNGTLTKYPLDVGVYDWAIETGLFKPRKPHETTTEFIQCFTTASQEHYHYDDEE